MTSRLVFPPSDEGLISTDCPVGIHTTDKGSSGKKRKLITWLFKLVENVSQPITKLNLFASDSQ